MIFHLHCVRCGQQIQDVAYAFPSLDGYLDEKCRDEYFKEQDGEV